MDHSIKINRAVEKYKGFKGNSTINAITERVPDELIEHLNSDQIALVMSAINKAYQDGKASAGAEMIDNNAVYINNIGRVIEWHEAGAVYKRVTEKESGCTVTKNVKVQEGTLVPRFAD